MKEEFVNFPAVDKTLPFFISLAGISYPDENYKITRLNSKCLCLEYILEGEGCVILDDKRYYPQKGDVYLLPPGKDHHYFSDSQNPWKKIWFNAEGSLINNLLAVYNPLDLVHFTNCNIKNHLKKIHDIGRNNNYLPLQKHECASVIFHEILQVLYNHSQKSDLSPETKILKDYIINNITKNISLKELSKLVYLSESQIIRIFKKEVGKTPYDYILDLKLNRAKTLLKNTNLMIKQIALNLGFCDEHYFSYVFKNKTGKTPSEYKKDC